MVKRWFVVLGVLGAAGPALAFRAAAEDAPPGSPVPFVAHRLGTFRSESLAVADINGDGRLDIIAGPYLYLAPDWRPVEFRTLAGSVNEQGIGYYDDFATIPLDVDLDGRLDVVSAGWFSKSLRWHRNVPGAEGPWPTDVLDTDGNFEGAALVDLDGDGQALEILGDTARTFWYEVGESMPGVHGLAKRVISDEPMHFGIGVGDVNGDGRPDVLRPNAWFEGPANPRQETWIAHRWALGAPGGEADHTARILVLDVNGDGRNDVIASTAHRAGIFWYEQVLDGESVTWRQHTIDDTWTQAHTLAPADLDGDGTPDLVTGKRFMAHNGSDPDAFGPLGVYWYRLARGQEPTWTKYALSFDEGIGSGIEIFAGDLDGDGDADVVVTGKWGGPLWFENQSR